MDTEGENEGCGQRQERCQVNITVNRDYSYGQSPREYARERILVLDQGWMREVLLAGDPLLKQELRF